MEFGKLESIENVDFKIPPDAEATDLLLKNKAKRIGNPKIYLGATGWAMKEWVGKFYPENAKPSDFLAEYARQFNTIEANTTHYRVPDAATILNWRAVTPPDFRFCPKMPQSISHTPNLGQNIADLPNFVKSMQLLGDRLGMIFMQMPPHFSPADLPRLEFFLKNWPTDLPLAVEVRHPSFFEKKNGTPFFQLIENQRVTLCLSDVAGRRDVLLPRLTTTTAMIRFISNGGHPSDFERAEDWANRLADWFLKGLNNVYFFAHAPDNLLSPEISMILAEKMREKIPNVEIRAPKPILKSAVQGSLF
jgi:uncharacterized protein YecE (DUF72 family)